MPRLDNIRPFLSLWLGERPAIDAIGLSTAEIHLMAYYCILGLALTGGVPETGIKERIKQAILSGIVYEKGSKCLKRGISFEDHKLCPHIHIVHTQVSVQLMQILYGNNMGKIFTNEDCYNIIKVVLSMQNTDNGCFRETEDVYAVQDSRFIYASLVIIEALLPYAKKFDENILLEVAETYKLTIEYLLKLWNYDGGAAFNPGMESHMAACYIELASLKILERLDLLEKDIKEYIPFPELTGLWINNLIFQGLPSRPCKEGCSCYMFWGVGSAVIYNEIFKDTINMENGKKYLTKFIEGEQVWFPLASFVKLISLFIGEKVDLSSHKILMSLDELSNEEQFSSVISCIKKYNFKIDHGDVTASLFCGFGKHGYGFPDPYHTTAVLQGLSFLGYEGLCPIDSATGLPLEKKDENNL